MAELPTSRQTSAVQPGLLRGIPIPAAQPAPNLQALNEAFKQGLLSGEELVERQATRPQEGLVRREALAQQLNELELLPTRRQQAIEESDRRAKLQELEIQAREQANRLADLELQALQNPLAGVTPGTASLEASPIPAPPLGADPEVWRQEMTKILAKEADPERQRERATAQEQQAAVSGFTLRDARLVEESLDRLSDNSIVRIAKSKIPGTEEYRTEQYIESLRGTIAIEQLLNIKRQGSGLGQVPQAQLNMLSTLMGRLTLGLPKEDLKRLVNDIQQRYREVLSHLTPEDRALVGIADQEMRTLTTNDSLPIVASQGDYEALAPGTRYRTADGEVGQKL